MNIEKVIVLLENRLARTMLQGRPVRQLSDHGWEVLKKDLRSLFRDKDTKVSVPSVSVPEVKNLPAVVPEEVEPFDISALFEMPEDLFPPIIDNHG